MKHWFEGKTVAVVGNALSLFDKEYGDLIDSHNIVCRVNKGIVGVPSRSHGVKTNVIAYSKYSVIKDSLPVLINPPNKFIHLSVKDYDDSMPIWCNKLTEHAFYSKKRYSLMKRKLKLVDKKVPSTGILLLDYISTCSPTSVTIFGFDWKDTPTFYDLDIIKETHNYAAERKYCLDFFIKTLGFRHYQ